MKHRKLGTNATLQRVLKVLRIARSQGDGSITTMQISKRAKILAVNSVMAELRENGCQISCEQRRDADGKPRWHYRLEKEPKDG